MALPLDEIVQALGLQNIPERFLEFCQNGAEPIDLCDVTQMETLEKRYGMLGKYYSTLREVALRVAENESLCTWCGWIAAYVAHAPIADVLAVPLPTPQDSLSVAYLRLLILFGAMPNGIRAYRARGFSEEELRQMLENVLGSRVAISEEISRQDGLDGSGFSWLLHYAQAMIFRAGIFNITPRPLYESSILLRNCVDGRYAVLVLSGTFHRSGIQLNNDDRADTEGSFGAEFNETEDAYMGHRIENARVLSEKECYPKQQWKEIVRQGGGVVGIHIPRDVALTEENIWEGYRIAFKICRERYPEVDVRAVHCSSWMLDSQLESLLGESSKIVRFQRTFLRYPMGNAGAAAYSFVFKCKKPEDLNTLPEHTSLQRKLKAMYLNGETLYAAGGYIPVDELVIS